MDAAPHFGPLEAALANGIRLLQMEPEAAADQAREILSKDEGNRPAMRLLGRALRKLGRNNEAVRVELDAIKAASNEPALVTTAQAIRGGDMQRAQEALRPYFERYPSDPAALRLLAEIAAAVGDTKRAVKYLAQAVEFAPAYVSARVKLAQILFHEGDFPGAVGQLDKLLELDLAEGSTGASTAATMVMMGEFQDAARLYQQVTEKVPDNPGLWISYAHVLNTVGRFEESVAAYRRAIDLRPVHGEAWWSLANLKMARFSAEDVTAMLAALDNPELDDKGRIRLHFALGKAIEDAGNYEQSFDQYAAGNRIQAAEVTYDPETIHQLALGSEGPFTPDYFRERAGCGATSTDPIFVVGMPRAGSTLVEQILASHSMIEGTTELQYIPAMRKRLNVESGSLYPVFMPGLSDDQLISLGEQYLSSARANRKTDRPYFIDKMPNNWASLGLILSILPNAKVIDARRHPMACCFSNFKQLYARGQEFSYSLDWMGRYYADYVRMMRHFDEILPGRVHRVIHEQLIDNPEDEIRALLDYIGVPFEESCLRFYENERPVRTPSAGQVRQPLNRRGIDQWRNFEPWLGELKAALGPVLTAYPDVPDRSELP